MDREARLELIQKIETLNKSRVIVYMTSDRGPVPALIAGDAVRQIYEHLLSLEKTHSQIEHLDLFIYSRGGDVSVPWQIVTMFREFCDEFHILIPYRAHSATTMIALGADKIVMGRKAELGPIDPTLTRSGFPGNSAPPPEISVEDVSSYLAFMRDRANINDQAALAQVVSQLADHLQPLTLGSVNRQYSHIRLVARKLLMSHKQRIEEDRLNPIIEALTEKMYSHGHAIGRREAAELGLPVEKATGELEDLMWRLFVLYEDWLKLNEPFDPHQTLLENNGEKYVGQFPLAVIESTERLDVVEMTGEFEFKRQVPANPQINLNINFGLPPELTMETIPQQAQQVLQYLIQQVQQALPQLIQQELTRQSPVVGIDAKFYGSMWKQQ